MFHKRSAILKIFSVLVMSTSCKKDPALWHIENMNANQISVLGHGGMGRSYKYTMDSFESLSKCLSIGADGCEMDVRMTKDSVLVLFHDDFLEQSTNCSGSIRESNWQDIQSCTYNKALNKSAIITLSDFLSNSNANNHTLVSFDCKLLLHENEAYLNTFANRILQLIEQYQLSENSFIESFNSDFLQIIHNKRQDLKLFLYTSEFSTGVELFESLPLFGLVMDTKKINEVDIKKAHEKGLRIMLFNVSSIKDNLEAVDKHPDYIQTDKLKHLLKIFGKYKED
jgi:glycerophosphoryl diester phosphodiesterase